MEARRSRRSHRRRHHHVHDHRRGTRRHRGGCHPGRARVEWRALGCSVGALVVVPLRLLPGHAGRCRNRADRRVCVAWRGPHLPSSAAQRLGSVCRPELDRVRRGHETGRATPANHHGAIRRWRRAAGNRVGVGDLADSVVNRRRCRIAVFVEGREFRLSSRMGRYATT